MRVAWRTAIAVVTAGLCAGFPVSGKSAQTAVPANLAPVAFLIGSWSGGGTSDAGTGTGTDSFTLDVQNQIVVRRSHAVYPPKDGHPGLTYDSLMVVYKDPAFPQLRADYFDAGGHVIHYSLAADQPANVVRFISDAAGRAPRFRLTYTDAPDDTKMTVKFEMAPPGSDAFTVPIADGVSTRVAQ